MSKVYLQEKITGAEGQVVMINSSGEAEAQTKEFGLKPRLVVTVESGSVVTVTNGTKSYQQTSAGAALTFELDGYGTWTASATKSGDTSNVVTTTVDTVRIYNVTLKFAIIYGVLWDGTSTTAFSRTDKSADFTDPVPYVSGAANYSSPFDDLMPWAGMVRVTDAEAGELVAIPKYWYKWTKTGASMSLQISPDAQDGFYVSPAHADRGDGSGERDVVYVGRYHCNSAYKSVTGVFPIGSITRATARSNIHALGSNIWQYDYAMFWTIRMLYLVEYANWDSQAVIGYGCGNNSGVQSVGASDSMPYHTGTMQSSRTTYGVGCQYRYIEGLWDNVFDWCDGIYFSGANIYCIKNPSSFSDSANGTNIGTRVQREFGNIIAWEMTSVAGFEYALYPSGVTGTGSIYISDLYIYDAGGVVLTSGGSYTQSQNFGLFYFNGYQPASTADGIVGCRLMKLP